jgi:hypothetical protein
MNTIEFSPANYAISGAILLGYWAIGLFFFQFQRRSNDRFFGFFGSSFWLLAVERILLLAIGPNEEIKPYVYVIRLVSFLFILYAIYDKNRAVEKLSTGSPPDSEPV